MNEPSRRPTRAPIALASPLLEYLASSAAKPGTRLPPIKELAEALGISTGKLREQLEVARQLGWVEVRPKTGIRSQVYSFYPCVQAGLRYALALDPAHFDQFGLLRMHIETAFWREAARRLNPSDIEYLQALIQRSWEKLHGDPIQIPHAEHRELHLTIYSRLDNPFVRGLLEAYWDAYEAVGLNLYADYRYLHEVWTYHEQMVEAIRTGELEVGYQALVEHMALLQSRPAPAGTAPEGEKLEAERDPLHVQG